MANGTVIMAPEEASEAILAGTCPAGAVVAGHLTLHGEPWLAELPKGLSVEGRLRIAGCHRLKRLPEGLSALGLAVENCCLLEGFDHAASLRFETPGDLSFSNCPSLRLLPVEAAAGGDLTIKDCQRAFGHSTGGPALAPRALQAGGSAFLAGLPGLVELRGRIRVGESLEIDGCPFLAQVGGGPERIRVGRGCRIARCHALRTVAGIEFAGDRGELAIRHCTALESIGDDVRPSGSLAVIGCPSLPRLPSGLALAGSLWANNCPALRLPDDLEVRGRVWQWGVDMRRAAAKGGPSPSP